MEQASVCCPLDIYSVFPKPHGRRCLRKGLGTVEAGKVADVLAVAADPTLDIAAMRKIRLVIRGGVVHPVPELAAPAR